MKSILIVDDDKDVLFYFKELLTTQNLVVRIASSADEALKKYKLNPTDYVLTDLIMPGGMDGLDFILELRQQAPKAKIYAMSGDPGVASRLNNLLAAKMFGADGIFTKPISKDQIEEKLFAA